MKNKFSYLVIGLVASLSLFVSTESMAKSEDKATSKYALLVNGAGEGFCTVKQDGKKVWAQVSVLNFTPTSAGTAWIKFDGVIVGRLDGTFSDDSGQAVFKGHFKLDKHTTDFSFDVRDHVRDISDIEDDIDLTTELTQSGSNTDGTSILMGSCTFVNAKDNNNDED